MTNARIKDYPDTTYISKEQLESNTTQAKILALVGTDKRVVDFGCATGYLGKLLAEQSCVTVGIDINPGVVKTAEQFCDRVIVADLDYENVEDILEKQTFDVAIFGDVLEHLRDPWQVLKSVKKILTPDGCVVASIPNIAHGAIRLALLDGRFDYQEFGILDNTHLRFFTRNSLYHLFESSGYCIESEDSTKLPVFNTSGLTPALDKESVSAELLDKVMSDILSDSLQFVVRAYPWSTAHGQKVLRNKCSSLQEQVKQSQMQLQQTQTELQQTQVQLQQTQTELQQTQVQLQQSQMQLQQTQTELQQTQVQLQQAQTELQQTQIQLQYIEKKLLWKAYRLTNRIKMGIKRRLSSQ